MKDDADSSCVSAGQRINKLQSQLKDVTDRLKSAQTAFANAQVAENVDYYGSEPARSISKSKEQRKLNQDQIAHIRISIASTLSTLNDQRRALSIATEKVSEALSSDEAYLKLKHNANTENLNFSDIKIRSDELLSEVKDKLPAFQNATAFQYLLNASFGTSQYDAHRFVKRIDNMIARHINYFVLKTHYELLLQIETAAKAMVSVPSKAYKAALNALQQYEETAYDIIEINSLNAAIQLTESQYESLQSDLNKLEDSARLFDNNSDPMSLAAQKYILENIKNQPLTTLSQLAETTESRKDDDALSDIKSAIATADKIREKIELAIAELRKAEARALRVKQLESSLKDSRITSSSYRYPSTETVNSILLGYIVGTYDSSTLVSTLINEREYIPSEPSYNPGSSHSGSSSSSSSNYDFMPRQSSSSSDSGSFSSSSSSDSGSFSTSDSF